MANLKTFSGFPIQNLSSDPVPFAQAKINDPYAGTWSSGGSMNTGRDSLAGTGIQTSALAVGGSPGISALNELYNGSSWTESGDLNTARKALAASGTSSTAALAFGGFTSPPTVDKSETETFNGSSWTEVANLATARHGLAGTGTNTAALAIGGYTTSPAAASALNESWNGSAWTETGDLNDARNYLGAAGTTTAALVAGGNETLTANTESWNGSSWTEVSDLNTARFGYGMNGTSTSALAYAGLSPPLGPPNFQTKTESWNGSAWTEVNDLSSVKGYIGGAGVNNTSALAFGGATPGPVSATTEEWAFTGIPPTAPAAGYSDAIVGQMYYNSTAGQFKAIKNGGAPIGTWASGGDLSGGKRHLGGAGYATAGLVFGGNAPSSVTAQTESYNGTSWSEVADLDNARNYVQGAGYQTAALAIAGSPPSTAGYTESWNGSSWSEVAALSRGSPSPQSDVYGMGCGIQTSALYFGGDEGGTNVKALNESWNGSSWSEEADMNVAKSYGVGIATSNQSAISAGGLDWAPGSSRNTPSNEEWNGSSWTEIAELNQGRGFLGGSSLGSTTNTIVFGGRNQGPSAIFTLTEFYDGTSWTEVGDMATTTQSMGYSGTPGGSGTFSAGGQTPSTVAKTEEFVAADFTINPVTTS